MKVNKLVNSNKELYFDVECCLAHLLMGLFNWRLHISKKK
jgi:hypothetical protein